jgi:type I restriction enzyme, S subunit
MKRKATARPAKATSRQSTLNFPTSSEADLVAEFAAAETSTKSGAKNRRKRTADFADDVDKHNKPQCDLSAISSQSAVKIDAPQIPNGWCWTTFKDATVNFDGQRVPIKKEDRERRSGEYPYYGASGVIDDIDDFLFDGEFLLVAEDGANLLSRSTPIAFRASGKFWVNNHAHVVQPANGVALRFIEYYLNSIDLKFFVSGSAQPKLNQANLNKIPIPLPSLPEQHRIVAEIEKQFTRLDAGVAALKRVQANLKRYRAAVLKAACEGKLVPTEAELANRGGTNFQSGAELLATISDLEANDLNPRRAGRLWGAGHVPDLTDEERLSLPDGWVWAKVRELGFDAENAVQVGPMSMKSSDFTDSGTPVLNVGCVQWGRFVESKLDHLTAEKAAEFERYRIKCGDVLFTRSGTVGRCAVAQPHQDGWLMTFHLLRARANPEKCLPSFLRIVFEGAPHIRRQTREASVGSTRAGFNTNLLGNLAIPLPPLAEQTRIVAEVERRLSVVDELEAVVSANLQRAARLRQSILQKAFTGELTGDGTCLRDPKASVERVV